MTKKAFAIRVSNVEPDELLGALMLHVARGAADLILAEAQKQRAAKLPADDGWLAVQLEALGRQFKGEITRALRDRGELARFLAPPPARPKKVRMQRVNGVLEATVTE